MTKLEQIHATRRAATMKHRLIVPMFQGARPQYSNAGHSWLDRIVLRSDSADIIHAPKGN